VLLALKHFPLSLLWMNGFYFCMRVGAGVVAGLKGKGEVSKFQGFGGKVRVMLAIIKGNLEAFTMIPKTIKKRRQFRHLRRLTPRQTRRLLLQYRITLKELMEQAI
jgi:hypothetical protein